jgi:integrase
MASIYQPKSKQKPGSRGVWFIGYTDATGKRRTMKGFTDKGETQRLASKLEHEVMLRKRGLIDPDMESLAEKRKKLLADQLKVFEKSLGNNTSKHVKLTMSRVRRVIDGIQAKTVGDLSVEAVEDFLAGMAEKDDVGNRTYNHYVQAIDAFCRWLVESKRAATNPLLGLKRLNNEVDVRHRRRALNPDEIQKLVNSARDSDELIQCFDGETRSRIYILAYMTGLRRNEIASLTPESFDLAAVPPTVTVEAAFSKHRRRDVIPLHPELVGMLRGWLPNYPSGAVLFPKLGRRRTWLMVKKDLERVGIEYETADGIADFHAAGRHTHITELLRNGATLSEAKGLARHSDIKMTMRYTHIGINDQAKALRQLPWNPSEKSPNSDSDPAAAKAESSNPQKRSGSESGVAACQSGASGDTVCDPTRNDATRVGDTGCRQKSLSVSDCQKWRRRELNPRPESRPRKVLRA